ncbi:YrhB domain-containing protein [Roseibium aggregatum]|uniref:Immunity protein 35 domain-containing protein n=1 Tax=Roseibium aggregatum TaxID=187304 RepID=A0A926S7V1_9HYPH|nr:YrhB domain-containing protein [Roseibium aggregatum]MBD1548710.1 hypothetical protein [Roseibium aggregatum]
MTAINRDAATDLARKEIDQLAEKIGMAVEIYSEETREIAQGWVFFYNSEEYMRTGNYRFQLAGNGPILVMREGKIHYLPTAIPWEDAVSQL